MKINGSVAEIPQTREYYLYYKEDAEFPWTLVFLRPSGQDEQGKWYLVAGANLQDGKMGYLPYRIDKKSRHMLGERMEYGAVPPQIKVFIDTVLSSPAPSLLRQ